MGIAKAKETSMRTVKLCALALLTLGVLLGMGGCTDQSSRAILTVVDVNSGQSYFSDLINEADTAHVFIPVDEIPVTLGNVQNDGGAPLAPGTPFSTIVVTGYTVTYDNGIFTPVSGGLTLRIPSGGTSDAAITLSNTAEKAALLSSLSGTVTTTARIVFHGFVQANGENNGDQVTAHASLTVQVGNFGDSDVNQ
jgi:hypothetical protein